MDVVQSSIDVYVTSPAVYLDSDTQSIEVYLNNPTSSISNDFDIASLDVYLNQTPSIANSDVFSLTVGLNPSEVINYFDISDLTVYINNNADILRETKQYNLTVNLTPDTIIKDFDTQSITVGLTGITTKSDFRQSSLTVGIKGVISTSFIECPTTVYLTGDSSLPFAESELTIIKYDTKYGDIRFTYPKSSNQPLGFEVVVYKALNGVYDPSNKSSYLTPMREVKQNTYIDETSTHYIYKAAWSPKAKDTEYPFKIAVRSVFFSGKSDWLVSVEHDI